jgi:hypothetical protein
LTLVLAAVEWMNFAAVVVVVERHRRLVYHQMDVFGARVDLSAPTVDS